MTQESQAARKHGTKTMAENQSLKITTCSQCSQMNHGHDHHPVGLFPLNCDSFMADRYDTGKPSSLHKQDRNNGAGTIFRELNLDDLMVYVTDLRKKYRIHGLILKSFHPECKLPEPSPRTEALSKNDRYHTEFLKEENYNMSIIDLNTESEDEHTIMSRFLIDSLFESSGGKHGPMVIYIFCYDQLEMLTPLILSTILLQVILNELFNDSYKDWNSIKVDYNGRFQDWREYEITMEILKVLISQVLEDYPEDTMHFVFGGMRPFDLDEDQRLSLARFMIDMGRLVRTVLPGGDKRKVKCTFSGNVLFECLSHHLESEKAQRRGNPKEEEIFRQMLMLAFDRHGEWENIWFRR
jgi:hypothetical protein